MIEGFTRRDGVLHCEDVPIPELVARWGTPLYVYSRTTIRERYHALAQALNPVPHLIAYSVKANANLAILRTLSDLGAGAHVISGGELQRARLAGIPGERIVFSGVGKTVHELAMGLSNQIYAFNVESEGELVTLSELATAMGLRAPIAIRINIDIDWPTPRANSRVGRDSQKFGIAAERARTLYSIAAKLPGIRVRGVDLHLGSQLLDPAPFGQALEAVLQLVRELEREGIPLESLDLGGGLGISYTDEPGVTAHEFAQAVVPQVSRSGLRLLVEPGRFIVGAAGVLVTRVIYVKEGGGKRFVITDAGMNDLNRPSQYSGWHEVEPVEASGRERAMVDIVGPIQEADDFLARDREMELPRPGELLAFHTVGAYGFTMSSQYTQRPRPAEVLVEDDTASLVRRRETFDDLVAAEIDLDDENRYAMEHAWRAAERSGDTGVLAERVRRDAVRSGVTHRGRGSAQTHRAGEQPRGTGAAVDAGTASTVAHRLENTIFRIETAARDMEMRLEPRSPLRKTAERIRLFADQAKAELDPLRPSRRVRDPVRDLLPVRPLLVRAFALAEQNGIPVVYDLPDALPPVIGEEKELGAAFAELARNAIHWLTSPGSEITVRARAVTRPNESRYVQVEVHDNGPGVPTASKERVFERYFTTRPSGSGLGLADVKQTILAHGGMIRETGTEGRGACFEVTLPAGGRPR